MVAAMALEEQPDGRGAGWRNTEIFGILDNMAKSLEDALAANAREDEAASKKRTPRRS